MKILKAPNELTVTRISSAGSIDFIEGIATEFTDAQAAHLCQTQKGYEVVDIVTDDEAKAADDAKIKADAKATTESENADTGLTGNIKNIPGVLVELCNRETGDVLASTTSDENGDWQLDVEVSSDKNDEFPVPDIEYEIRFSGAEGVSEDDTITDADVEKPADAEVTTDAAQNASDDAQAAPKDTSSETGTGASPEVKEADEVANDVIPVTMPTMNDNHKTIGKFCDKYEIDKTGTKRQILKRIWDDPRFKK